MTIGYISKHKAVEETKKYIISSGVRNQSTWNECVRTIADTLQDIQPAEVVQVVHGEYVGEYDGYADGHPVCDMWYCSVCGCHFEDWDEKPTYNYCPQCGAKMDGGTREREI